MVVPCRTTHTQRSAPYGYTLNTMLRRRSGSEPGGLSCCSERTVPNGWRPERHSSRTAPSHHRHARPHPPDGRSNHTCRGEPSARRSSMHDDHRGVASTTQSVDNAHNTATRSRRHRQRGVHRRGDRRPSAPPSMTATRPDRSTPRATIRPDESSVPPPPPPEPPTRHQCPATIAPTPTPPQRAAHRHGSPILDGCGTRCTTPHRPPTVLLPGGPCRSPHTLPLPHAPDTTRTSRRTFRDRTFHTPCTPQRSPRRSPLGNDPCTFRS